VCEAKVSGHFSEPLPQIPSSNVPNFHNVIQSSLD